MALILALAVAVAGGNLVVTTAPEKVRAGRSVAVRATGQVGDTGRLWIYHDRKGCLVDVRAERRRGTLITTRSIVGSFDFQSVRGKVAGGVAALATEHGVPCLVLAGQVSLGRQQAAAAGVEAAYSVVEQAGSVEAAMERPGDRLAELAARVAREWSRRV